MWYHYLLLAVAIIFGIWQVYVLVSGRAKFGGYTVPSVLLILCLGLAYWSWSAISTPAVPLYDSSTGMMGGRRRRR